MEMIAKFAPQATAGFAALAFSLVSISATVAPVDFAAAPVTSQALVA